MSTILPNALIQRLGNDPFFDQEGFLAAHQAGDKLTSVRINPDKPSDLLFPLHHQVPWCPTGYYLDERPVFTLDPLFHAGCYYVQEASSMFLSHIIAVLGLDSKAVRALDCCAAPGGKSTLLNARLSKDSLLVANEIIKNRAIVLKENHVRWGTANVVVSHNDPSAFKRLPGIFRSAARRCTMLGIRYVSQGRTKYRQMVRGCRQIMRGAAATYFIASARKSGERWLCLVFYLFLFPRGK